MSRYYQQSNIKDIYYPTNMEGNNNEVISKRFIMEEICEGNIVEEISKIQIHEVICNGNIA